MPVSCFTDAIWSVAGYKPAQEVCCDSVKASVLQASIVATLENPKENNVIICLRFKLYGKTSKAMAGQARRVPP